MCVCLLGGYVYTINKESKTYGFKELIDEYLLNIENLFRIVEIIIPFAYDSLKKSNKSLKRFIKDGSLIKSENTKTHITYQLVKPDNKIEIDKLFKDFETFIIVPKTIPQQFIVMLISEYENFVRVIVKCFLLDFPQKLKSKSQQFTNEEILSYNNLEDIKEEIINHIINSLLNEPTSKQIESISKYVDVELKEYLPNWKEFIEVSLRRNIITHNSCCANELYFNKCAEEGIGVERIKLGKELINDYTYCRNALYIFYKVGLIIGYLILRKHYQNIKSDVDFYFNEKIYRYIEKQNFNDAIELAKIQLKIMKKYGYLENNYLFTLLNLIQAYKWSGKDDEVHKLIDEHDFSAKDYLFKLVRAVLLDDFDEALINMKKIGSKHDLIDSKSYKEWFIFKEFRKTEKFKEVYKEIFDKEFFEETIIKK